MKFSTHLMVYLAFFGFMLSTASATENVNYIGKQDIAIDVFLLSNDANQTTLSSINKTADNSKVVSYLLGYTDALYTITASIYNLKENQRITYVKDTYKKMYSAVKLQVKGKQLTDNEIIKIFQKESDKTKLVCDKTDVKKRD